MSFIKSIEINGLCFPLMKGFSNHVRHITHINAIEVIISTYSGFVGAGFVYSLGIVSRTKIISYLKHVLIPNLFELGKHVYSADELKDKWNILWYIYKNAKLDQDQLYALSSIDIAIWDIFIKSKNISLHQFLGGTQTRIPAYGTTGWLSLTVNELIDECRSYIDLGINAFKVRLGHSDDYSRVKALRSKFGDKLIIMLDANQRYNIEETSFISKKLSKFNVLWLEEPTNNELLNIEKLKKASHLPIALGETICDENVFEEICKRKLVDFLQPDIPRCGGITGFCRVANIALKYDIPICNHLLFELSANLVSAYPNGFMLEYDNFLPPEIFTYDYRAKDGAVIASSIPGTGVVLLDKFRKKYLAETIKISDSMYGLSGG